MVTVPISTMLLLAAAAAIAAAVVSNLAAPVVARLAMAVRALDYPGGRKQQETATPRLGGIAIAGGVAFAAAGVALARWVQLSTTIHRSEMIALAMSGALIFFVGFVDDLIGVSTWHKFAAQVLAALLLVHVGWQFQVLSLPGSGAILLGSFGPLLTVLWIVGVTNAVNLLDGLDGLAAGVVAIIAASLLAYALMLGNLGTVILMAAITGACLGFLRHNWAPAKIFMGDSGSLTLGFLLGAMTVHGALKAPAAIAILVPLLALGVPVIDTLLVMVVRFLSRSHGALGERILGMFRADRNHIHHLLLRRRGTGRRVVAWIYGTVLTFCVLAVLVAVTRNRTLGILVLAIEGAVIVALRQSGLRARLAETSSEQRQSLRSELGVESRDGDSTGDLAAQVVAFPEPKRRSEGG
ncbi:MAG TPA: MraY family glycosyltransferase [Thermoanaerobaculia bacterium]|jgi:UDP-GlcNAc:undecaprenyl-phosphate GlcNAc-1-phosphate transferase|nr:MraY family glycosyltransferase [Thermoanaerobaculia bacterium]